MVDFFTWVGHVYRRVTMNHQRFKATLGLQMALSILWQRSIAWHRWFFVARATYFVAASVNDELAIENPSYIICLFIDYRWSVHEEWRLQTLPCLIATWHPNVLQVDLLWPRRLCTWQLWFLRSRRSGAREHFTNGSLEVKIAATGTVSASELQLGRWQVCKWFK